MELLILVLILVLPVGCMTQCVVEKHGEWDAYGRCLINHTPAECAPLRPNKLKDEKL